jgi:hypothetical protein
MSMTGPTGAHVKPVKLTGVLQSIVSLWVSGLIAVEDNALRKMIDVLHGRSCPR